LLLEVRFDTTRTIPESGYVDKSFKLLWDSATLISEMKKFPNLSRVSMDWVVNETRGPLISDITDIMERQYRLAVYARLRARLLVLRIPAELHYQAPVGCLPKALLRMVAENLCVYVQVCQGPTRESNEGYMGICRIWDCDAEVQRVGNI
jgi:hypothetical protein